MKYAKPRPPQFKLAVKKSAAGLGIFAAEDIPKGRFLIEYWGPIVTDAEAQEVAGKYLWELGNGKTILGAGRENTARYVNHSCRPNAEARTVGNRCYLFSTKHISAGEEIGYDYGKEYFDYYIKPYGCKCDWHRKRGK